MKYFLDTEFLEGTQEPKWLMLKSRLGHWMIGKPKPTIDLISIGIVAEDGREYYAISKEFNLKEAWNRFDLKQYEKGDFKWKDGIENGEVEWVPNEKGKVTIDNPKKVYWIRENVLLPIWKDLFFKSEMEFAMLSNGQTDEFYANLMSGMYDACFTFKSLKSLISKHGKTNKQIAEEIKEFVGVNQDYEVLRKDTLKVDYNAKPQFYAYYADYDWVGFCWLFGKMMDLPNGFPMYCRDLKQMLDEKPLEYKVVTAFKDDKYIGGCDPYYAKWEEHIDYPKQENEHNALDDARWNKKLYEFLNQL